MIRRNRNVLVVYFWGKSSTRVHGPHTASSSLEITNYFNNLISFDMEFVTQLILILLLELLPKV